MNKITAGIIIGCILMLGVKVVSAVIYSTQVTQIPDSVEKFQDGNTVCYIYKEMTFNFADARTIGGISCVRIK